ncbi:SGNH/GDSL hydrolase family protein [Pseudoflavitalea sp. X16]|uniref:SGNH/GDSL hydrolase family protein n=1 Tax=Paraflavitalea devenefica TaxID=2716334 RepID=UPI0014249C20|nr:SGNH/GDSL hydrolase family protein [Paraflavitalea devenefica]NII27365.1 SGNH/GDSL hydrolase family protein [Paraflavitalea devenefica]
MRSYLCLLTAVLLSNLALAQNKSAEDTEREKLIAASQSGASPLFFDPAARDIPVIQPGDFNDLGEFVVRHGLPNFFHKAKAGKPVTIAYIGGSITQAIYGYRTRSARYIQSLFPSTPMKAINAGVSGTGTDLGSCRLQEQVLQYHPDLIFIEFAVNGAYRDGMEGMIRQIRQYDPHIDICLIYTIHGEQTKIYAAGEVPENIQGLEAITAYYNIPSIHLGMEAAMLEKADKLTWKGDSAVPGKVLFSRDGTHPLEEGGNLYAAAIARAFNAMQNKAAMVKYTLPAPLIPDNWEDAKMVAPSVAQFSKEFKKVSTAQDEKLKQFAGWFPYVMMAEQPGASFTFRFRGSMFGFFDIGGPESGQVEVRVDGKPVRVKEKGIKGSRTLEINDQGHEVVNRFFTFCNNRYRGQYELIAVTPGEHVVTITLSAQKSDKAAILGSKQLADITANPAKYDRTVVYIGKILVRGEVLK